jgi:hypothetical protein
VIATSTFVLRPERHWRCTGFLVGQLAPGVQVPWLPSGIPICRPIRFDVPESLLDPSVLKSSELGKTYQDSEGGFRWITVKPHGDAEHGVPVKIRESKTERGTWHIVGGAGGKLNYLRLTNVKSPAEYREHAVAKRKQKQAAKEEKQQQHLQRRAGMSEEEQKIDTERQRERAAKLQAEHDKLHTARQEHIAAVAHALGWDDDEWKFDARRDRLKRAGASDERVEKQEARHHKRVFEKAEAAVAATKRQLLADPERAREVLGDIPITTQDPEHVGLTDLLDPPKKPTGQGFQNITRESSDAEIRRAASEANVEKLRQALEDAQLAAADATYEGADYLWGGESNAAIDQARGELRMAELIRQGATLTPEQIAQRRKDVEGAIAEVREGRKGYLEKLGELRSAFREKKDAGARMPGELADLETRNWEDLGRLRVLEEQLTDVAVMAGETVQPALAGEKEAVRAGKQAQREREISAEHGEKGVAAYRGRLALLENAREGYLAEMRQLKEAGAVKPVELPAKPVVDPEKALELVARSKAIKAAERKLSEAGAADDDERMFGKGYFGETGVLSPEQLEAAKRDIKNSVTERVTRAFLEKAESPELLLGRGGVFTEDHSRQDLHNALERHVSAGAYNVVNNAALAAFKGSTISREVVDTLGAAGAAQLLAHQIRKHEDARTAREMAAGLGEYHVSENVVKAEDRVREVEEALEKADEHLAALTNPGEVATAVEANRARARSLEEARQTVGQALGEYEATAALVKALGEKGRDSIDTNLGPIGTETAVRQMRALGLARGDYELTSDGTNWFASVKNTGFDKLVTAPDRERAKIADEVAAIKGGERDEKGWVPKGIVVRPATTFSATGQEPPSLTANLKAFNNFGSTGDVGADVREYVARRAGNGENLNDVLTDLHGGMGQVPTPHRQAFAAEIDKHFPATQPLVERGKPVYQTDAIGNVRKDEAGNPIPKLRAMKAEEHEDKVAALAEAHWRDQGVGEGAPLHSQAISAADPKTHEAMFRALTQDPRAMVAFTPASELTDQHQRALRQYFAGDVARQDVKTGFNQQALEADLKAIGEEPTKTEKGGLFGDETTSQAWIEWNHRRQQIHERHHFTGEEPRTTAWDEYTRVMGGPQNAYAALQDRLKSTFLRRFHQGYTTLHDRPLRVGIRDVAHAELHAGYLDPDVREKMVAKHRELVDEARTRASGRYATGSALEKLERIQQGDELARQNQMGLGLGATQTATSRGEPKAHQRYSLGHRVEAQIASLMPNVAKNFRPDAGGVKLLPDNHYDGKFIHQQRAIKTFLATKRMAAALGTGSGKTGIAIGALAHARSDPKSGVKRGLFVVPSSVQGQFTSEFGKFADPQKMHWTGWPGADHAERVSEHANPDAHAVVHTHQSFRDDMLKLVGKHWGLDAAKTKEKFMGLSRADAAKAMRETWDKHGIDYQMMVVDEGHGLLDREGKPDSLLSRMAQAASDNTSHYMSASADPIKNDVSELRSLLDKMEPSGRYGDKGDWNRRYGVNTTAAAEALKREVSPYVYAAHISTGNTVNRRRETVPLHPKQHEGYARVMGAYERIRAARGRGELDEAAARELVGPMPFVGLDRVDAPELVRQIHRNPGAYKEHALAEVVESAPRGENAKIQKLTTLLKDHPVRDKPVVVFAHRLAAVDEITEALAESGHRVEKLTGADPTKERDRKRRRFHPESGDPEADVFVLSDAGAAGLNLQRGQTLVQYDRPMTAMIHAQREGRINRLGQRHPEIDLVDMTTDTPFEARAQRRIETKYALRNILTDPAASIDDEGIAGVFSAARRRAAQPPERKVA